MSKNSEPTPRYSRNLDRWLQANIGKMTGGISPAALMLAFFDWYAHFVIHPDKHIELTENLQNHLLKLYEYMMTPQACDHCVDPLPQDKRFINKAWQKPPFNFFYQSFLITEQWWHQATKNIPGLSQHHEDVVSFTARQFLDMFSPSNYLFTNPEVLQTTQEEKGQNLVRGFLNFIEDQRRLMLEEGPVGSEEFVLGKNIAITPGKVVYRNRLIELIQYAPTTKQVYSNPIFIVPAWIMKYYILDLTPQHSLVKYLVKNGHTVFMVSWKNPTAEDRNLSMDDYASLGVMSALDVISDIVPKRKIHLAGYCLGGTLATIVAAAMAREKNNCLASLTLFASQIDFTEPGELGLFIDESQITYLANLMWDKGYLDTKQMTGAFQLLRSNDLIWSRSVHDYLLGKRKPLTDLMAWNSDTTRMPYRMHTDYLRKLFLNNELAEGKYLINHKPIALTDIRIPSFVVATEKDHVSPWRSVFKFNLLTDTDVTFVLTSGGHNVGIVSVPKKTKIKRYYRIATLLENDRYVDPDSWYTDINPKPGSWWPEWENWIAKRSGKKVFPPEMGSKEFKHLPLEDAPGTYVLQK